MAYLKPQSPLEKEGNYFYPLTTADQVILDDGSRLDKKLGNNNEQFKVLISTEWNGASAPYTQEITVPEIKEGDTPIADIVLADDYGTAAIQEKEWGKIFKIATADEKIVVYANALTEIELEVQMIVSRDKILTVEELPEGFVGERELAPASVNTEKLANSAVTTEKLANGVIPDALGYTPGMVNPNLLDNWYFVGGGSQQGGGQFPINQRGQTSYTGVGYGIDRWTDLGANATIALQASGLEINANGQHFQYIEPSRMLNGAVYTISSIVDGELYSHTFLYDNTEVSGTAHFVSCGQKASLVFYPNLFSTGNNAVGFNNVTQKVETIAIKLELGSRQTLAHKENGVWVLNEIPDYGEQLARCQRYYISIDIFSLHIGRTYGDGVWRFFVTTPVEMRTTPTLIITNGPGAAYIYGRYIPLSSLTVMGKHPTGILLMGTSSTSGLGDSPAVLVDVGYQLIADL